MKRLELHAAVVLFFVWYTFCWLKPGKNVQNARSSFCRVYCLERLSSRVGCLSMAIEFWMRTLLASKVACVSSFKDTSGVNSCWMRNWQAFGCGWICYTYMIWYDMIWYCIIVCWIMYAICLLYYSCLLWAQYTQNNLHGPKQFA